MTNEKLLLAVWAELLLLRRELSRLADVHHAKLPDHIQRQLANKWEAQREGDSRSVENAIRNFLEDA